MHKHSLTLAWRLAILLSLIAGTQVAKACPFCLAPPETWAEILSGADVVIVAEMVQLRTFDTERRAETEFRIHQVKYPTFEQRRISVLRHHEHQPRGKALQWGFQLNPGQLLTLQKYVTGQSGDLFLIVGRRIVPNETATHSTYEFTQQELTTPIQQVTASTGQTVNSGTSVTATIHSVALSSTEPQRGLSQTTPTDNSLSLDLITWDSPTAVSSAAVAYVLNTPDNAVPAAQRLPYYIPFLESTDAEISGDAWAEFARSQYEDVKAVRQLLPADQLRRWIADPNMSPERLGLYGMMIGLCGRAEDAEYLREQIGVPSDDRAFRYGIEGLMGGVMLLEGVDGLTFLEQTRLTAADCSSDELFAAVQAIQFMWSYEPDRIPQSHLRTSLHALLTNPQLCELVITNLSRWQDWLWRSAQARFCSPLTRRSTPACRCSS